MDDFTTAIYQNRLPQDVNAVAPLATTYHTAAPTPLATPVQQYTPAPSNLAKAANFFKDVGSSVGHVTATAVGWLGKQALTAVEAPVKFGADSAHLILDNSSIDTVNKNSALTSDRIDALTQQYKAGQITKEDYQKGMNGYAQDMDNLEAQTNAVTKQTTIDAGSFVKSSINTASDIVTIMTGGVAGVPLRSIGLTTAAKWLSSDAADATLFRGASTLANLSVNDAAFSALPEVTQVAMQRAVAEVVANTTVHLSAPQIARATVVNLAIKAPISFNYLSSSATDLYHQLDNEQYGSAMRNAAINSLLVLGGGPVGEALGFLKKGSSIAQDKIFGEGSFIDELSKNTGDRKPAGIINYLNSLPEDVRTQYVKDLSSTAARNTIASKGNAVQGAWRILNNMQAMYHEVDWRNLTHGEIVEDMMKEARAARIASEAGSLRGIKNVVVGRLDRRDLQTISATLTGGTKPADNLVKAADTKAYAKKFNVSIDKAKADLLETMVDTGKITAEQAAGVSEPLTTDVVLKRWEGMKQQFPNAAWANNANFDRQIKALAQKYTDPATLDKALRNISTQEVIEGMPSKVKGELAKLGYIPIVPKNLENPFVEGSGTLPTKFGDNNLFTKAVQPMPVASQLGNVLTNIGMSPQLSDSRVYTMFHNSLTEKFRDAGVLEAAIHGETHEQQADSLYKQLSSYAANPTRGGFKGVRAPITDMRQLTTKDIAAATGKSSADAKRIASSLKDAWLSVPLQTRGLGDRAVDLSYKLVPTTGAYARIMGATRFAWNPFFQAKTLTKTESLVQLKTGGTWPTTLGMDKVLGTIFPDKYTGIEKTRAQLREAGIFSSEHGGVIAGEAVEMGGQSSAQFTHKLLGGQEKAIAALVGVQAEKMGVDTAEYIKSYPTQARDVVQAIAGYDKSSALLNSPMARTLNLAFFPYRFEAKVTGVMANALAKTSPITQMAFIRGLYNGSQWLKSPEGQVWYSQNSEVIGLLKYFTPLTTVATLAEAFGQKPDSVGQFGELGGLPFGFIPMLLDAEGITSGLTQSPYVNPKTGQVLPNYVPVTDKGHAIAAVQDFLGSLFTYPGTQAGLPSKSAFFHDLSTSLLAGHNSDFNKVTPQITNQGQQDFATAVQQANGTTQPQSSAQPQPNNQSVNVPAQQPTTPIRTKSGTTKKKKADYTPAILPGQTVLGQL